MLACTAFSAFTLLYLICDVAALDWEIVRPEDQRRGKIVECILKSGRLDVVNFQSDSGASSNDTLSPALIATVDKGKGHQVVVCYANTTGSVIYFFAAITLTDRIKTANRLGNPYNADKRPKSKKEAKAEAELYVRWAALPFQENWNYVENLQQFEIAAMQVLNGNNFKLKWLWTPVKRPMIGIYVQVVKTKETMEVRVPTYLFATGSNLHTNSPTILKVSKPGRIGAIESSLARTLIEPAFVSGWLSKEEFDTIYNVMQARRNVIRSKMLQVLPEMGNIIVTEARVWTVKEHCDNLAVLFYNSNISTYILAVGYGLRTKLTFWKSFKDYKERDSILEAYYPLSFAPGALTKNGGWLSPSVYEKESTEPEINFSNFELEIREYAPFTITQEDKLYLQKVRPGNVGNFATLTAIFGLNGTYFAVIFDCIQGGWSLATVGELRFAKHIETDANSCAERTFEKNNLEFFKKWVEPGLCEIFTKIKRDLIDVSKAWENSEVEPEARHKWLQSHEQIVAPIYSRNGVGPATIHSLVCYFNPNANVATRTPADANSNFKYFDVLIQVVDNRLELGVPGFETYSAPRDTKESPTAFSKDLRKFHDRAIAFSKLEYEDNLVL